MQKHREGRRPMIIAFTFPGQGSQAVGMGKDLADAFAEARAVFDEVDDALGEKLSETIWNGPEETLTLTANAQPALMAVSIAAIRVMEARGQIGRASCRERVCQYVEISGVAGSSKKKK